MLCLCSQDVIIILTNMLSCLDYGEITTLDGILHSMTKTKSLKMHK